jgi:hypothetical protein
MKLLPTICALGFCLTSVAMAQSKRLELKEELRQCRLMEDANKRLACYDQLTPLPWGAAPTTAVVSQTAAPTQSGPSSATPAAAAFGLPKARAPETEQAMESTIAGRFEGWRSGDLITLANRQVWQVVDGTEASYSLTNPKVLVKRGALGSFTMEIEGVAVTPKVRRVR